MLSSHPLKSAEFLLRILVVAFASLVIRSQGMDPIDFINGTIGERNDIEVAVWTRQ